ncbi:MAG: energy transducer TonB, partial [Parahaliea sp.]
MKVKFVKAAAVVLTGALTLSAGSALAQEAQTLDQLLDFVKKGQVTEARENRDREQRFAQAKAEQANMLKQAENERAAEENRSSELEATFEENELLVTEKQKVLKERL